MTVYEAIQKLMQKYNNMTVEEQKAVYESTEQFVKKLGFEAYEMEYNPIETFYFYNTIENNNLVSIEVIFEKANKKIKFFKKINPNIDYFNGGYLSKEPVNLFFKYKKPDDVYIKKH